MVGPGAGALGGQRCNVPTYRKGRELALEEANGATFPPIGRVGSWRSRRPTVQRSHLSEGSGAGARGGQRCNVPTYRKGRELALEEANGATFPPIGRVGSWRSRRPTVQRFHLWQGREPVPWEANGAVFPPATRPAGAADSDERYSVPTYGRAGSRCPGRPTVQGSRGPDEGGGGDKAYQQCRISTDPEEDSRSRHN